MALPDGSIGDFLSATLLFRGPSGDLRGILNYFPYGAPGIEAPGNLLVIVDPDYRGNGIARELVAEADRRWCIDFYQQDYTTEGRATALAYLKARDQR